MIKVQFKKQDKPMVKFSSEDDYIPFTLTFGNKTILPEPIYTRNLDGENFIEFRFDNNDKSIYEITLVAFEPNTIIPSEPFVSDVIEDGYFSCITEGEIEAEYSLPIEILRSESSICVNWYNKDNPPSKYYSLSQNCIFGVDINNCLISIVLSELSKDNIYNIFGF